MVPQQAFVVVLFSLFVVAIFSSSRPLSVHFAWLCFPYPFFASLLAVLQFYLHPSNLAHPPPLALHRPMLVVVFSVVSMPPQSLLHPCPPSLGSSLPHHLRRLVVGCNRSSIRSMLFV